MEEEAKKSEEIKEEGGKMCPAFKVPCIEDKCAVFIRIGSVNQLGAVVTKGMCAPVAQCLISSRPPQPPQMVRLPSLKR